VRPFLYDICIGMSTERLVAWDSSSTPARLFTPRVEKKRRPGREVTSRPRSVEPASFCRIALDAECDGTGVDS
jgi:hypothetical protein